MFSYLKKIEPKKKLSKREITKLIKIAERQATVNGLTSSHKYFIVQKAIHDLKKQSIEPTIRLKELMKDSAKAWLKDCIEYQINYKA